MRIIDADRSYIYAVLRGIFQQLKCNPKIAEVGVLKGKNATVMHDALKPQQMVLIDSWSNDSVGRYRSINSHRPWVADPSKFEFYYGGSIDEQSTYDSIFEEAKSNLAGTSNVEFLKSNSLDAVKILEQRKQDKFEFIYLDASHQYEEVLDDLMNYRKLLHDQLGCFQLNDCCHSAAGVNQNFGVLEAAQKFCKLSNFEPALIVNRDFTDVLLAPINSPMIKNINVMLDFNNISYVEIPSALFPNLSVNTGKRANLSFV